jgi:membrane-associated phospholipid phosphatase
MVQPECRVGLLLLPAHVHSGLFPAVARAFQTACPVSGDAEATASHAAGCSSRRQFTVEPAANLASCPDPCSFPSGHASNSMSVAWFTSLYVIWWVWKSPPFSSC